MVDRPQTLTTRSEINPVTHPTRELATAPIHRFSLPIKNRYDAISHQICHPTELRLNKLISTNQRISHQRTSQPRDLNELRIYRRT